MFIISIHTHTTHDQIKRKTDRNKCACVYVFGLCIVVKFPKGKKKIRRQQPKCKGTAYYVKRIYEQCSQNSNEILYLCLMHNDEHSCICLWEHCNQTHSCFVAITYSFFFISNYMRTYFNANHSMPYSNRCCLTRYSEILQQRKKKSLKLEKKMVFPNKKIPNMDFIINWCLRMWKRMLFQLQMFNAWSTREFYVYEMCSTKWNLQQNFTYWHSVPQTKFKPIVLFTKYFSYINLNMYEHILLEQQIKVPNCVMWLSTMYNSIQIDVWHVTICCRRLLNEKISKVSQLYIQHNAK